MSLQREKNRNTNTQERVEIQIQCLRSFHVHVCKECNKGTTELWGHSIHVESNLSEPKKNIYVFNWFPTNCFSRSSFEGKPVIACVRGSPMVPLVGNICTIGTNLITNGTIGKEIGANGKNGNAIVTNGTNATDKNMPL